MSGTRTYRRLLAHPSCCALLLIALAGCESPMGFVEEEGQGKSPLNSEEFYAEDTVWHIDLVLSDANYDALAASPRSYVAGAVRIGDTVVENVGVRLKGAFSFQGLGGKSSFKIKFNAFDEGKRFLGLEKLTLNNMRQDRAEVHEWLSYQIFAAAGVPTPRSGYANVSLNGSLYGLYANVETVDDRFLKDRYEDGRGNLYEAPWGADLDAESVGLFEQDEGGDTSREDLDALVVQVAQPGDSVFFGDEAVVDTDEFLRFVTSEAITGHWDGYWKSNNYFLYHEGASAGPGAGRWTFMPWGLDQSFGQELRPFDSRGVLAEKCYALPDCVAEYARVGGEVLEAFEALDLASKVDGIASRILEYVESDPRSPHPPAKILRYQAIAKARLETVGSQMREHFRCIENGGEVDRDNDGFGGCFADCNDASDTAYPGATEVCDGIDNDCDGQVDELACPCTEVEIAGQELLFCEAEVPWGVAARLCEERGASLAVFTEREASEAAYEMARELGIERSWHIGATDADEEGRWLGPSGTELSALFFAPGEPDDFGGEHCAALASYAGGDWEDVRCSTRLAYICLESDD